MHTFKQLRKQAHSARNGQTFARVNRMSAQQLREHLGLPLHDCPHCTCSAPAVDAAFNTLAATRSTGESVGPQLPDESLVEYLERIDTWATGQG